jgi:hypothetical protein
VSGSSLVLVLVLVLERSMLVSGTTTRR